MYEQSISSGDESFQRRKLSLDTTQPNLVQKEERQQGKRKRIEGKMRNTSKVEKLLFIINLTGRRTNKVYAVLQTDVI